MVGDDGLTMEQRLEKYSGVTDWEYLRAACMYDVLYYVDESLILREVAQSFLDDDTEQIQAWLQAGDLVKLGELHLKHLDKDKAKPFHATVVSPFVLCQELSEESR